MSCSPLGDADNFSCFMLNDLKHIARELNKSGVFVPDTDDKKILHNYISIHMERSGQCKEESCWVSTKSATKFKDRFVPIMPDKWRKKPGMWLNTSDIDKVLKQYSKANDDFYYYGAVPIDFDLQEDNNCLVSDICKMSLTKHYKNGIKKIGIVYNTDPSTKEGEHWISSIIDLEGINRNKLLNKNVKNIKRSKERKKLENIEDETIHGMYFFDSVSDPAPKQVKKLYKRLKTQANDLGKNLHFFQNDVPHQLGNNECGIYSIYFIHNMLKGRGFFDIVEDIKRDKDMHEYRKVYFRAKSESELKTKKTKKRKKQKKKRNKKSKKKSKRSKKKSKRSNKKSKRSKKKV